MSEDFDDLVRPDIHSSALQYRQRFSGGVGHWFLQTQSQLTEEMLKASSGAAAGRRLTVIDFGGGHGQNIAPCKALNADLTILASDKSCFLLIDKEFTSGEFKKHVALLHDSALAQNSFDIALSYRMLPHLKDWQAHVKELCRVAEKSVIIEFPNRSSINLLSDKLFALKKSVEGNTRAFVLFDLATVSDEFARHGFFLEEVRGQYLWPMVLHRILKNRTISELLEKFASIILPKSKFGSPLICKYSVAK